jgi:hypothetical protein
VLRNDDGEPFFVCNDDTKHWKALRLVLCPICGERLGRWQWFVGGPGSAFDPNGWYIDLPMHHECVTFALQYCPYLSAPRYLREVGITNPEKLPPQAKILIDETVDPQRPALFVAVATSKIHLKDNGILLPYVRPVRPALAYEFWLHGKRLELHEALPILRDVFGADWSLPATAERT